MNKVKVMKSITKACVILLAGALIYGCAEELSTGIDSAKVAPSDVTYDENNSSGTTLGFYWEVDEAIAAGAVSFTAQIVQDEEIGGDAYTGKTSQTFQATSRPNDGAIFNGLVENTRYYARVRANYPFSVYSEWVYVTDKNGEKAVIKLGEGIVEDQMQTITGASARLVAVSGSTAVVEWSVTDFTDRQLDMSCGASIELYKDKECQDIHVSWDITDKTLHAGQPRFIFSGLEPETSYWFVARIQVSEDEEDAVTYVSEPLELVTEATKAVGMPASATEGQTILYQDFGELVWGGDAVNQAIGYSAQKRSSVATLKNARGWNPVGGDYGFYLCTSGTEMGLYNSIQKALSGSHTTLSQWAELREDQAVAGMLCGRPGSVKIGASSKTGWIVTPELSALSGTATIEVSFKASPFGSNIETLDPLGTSIRILDGVAVDANIVTGASVNSIVHEFNLVNDLSMKEYSFLIYNATASSRIAIGPQRSQGESGQHRMVIDDICVKVVKYEETVIPVEKPVVSLAAGEGMLMATWAECTNAGSYDVEYKKEGDSVWTSAGTTTYTNITLKGLYQESLYHVRVRAKYSDKYTSEWSDPVSVRTPVVNAEVTVYAPVVTESQIGFKWYTDEDLASDIQTPYMLQLYKGGELKVRLVLGANGVPDRSAMTITGTVLGGTNTMNAIWNATAGPCFLFSGLEPGTAYTLKVTNRELQISGEYTMTTTQSDYVQLPQSAQPGQTLLYEPFSELLWGGFPRLSGFAYGMPGVNSERRSTLDRFYYISGEQPLSNDAYRLWLCVPTTNYGLFSTARNAVANTRLKDWGAISESYDGNAAGSLCGMAGMIKLGAASSWSQILTPPLTCLSGPSTIEVSFDMCAYTEDGKKIIDPLDAIVKVMDNVKLGVNGDMSQAYLSGTVSDERQFTISSNISSMTRYTYTFENVKPGARIAIGTYRPSGAGAGQRRAFLDNVQITLK